MHAKAKFNKEKERNAGQCDERSASARAVNAISRRWKMKTHKHCQHSARKA